MANYSRESEATLTATAADLSTIYSAGELSDVATINTVYVRQGATGNYYPVHEFKNDAGANTLATFTMVAKCDTAPSVLPVKLQIYNTSTGWELLTSDTTSAANVDFTLGVSNKDISANYKDVSNVVCCRVYQEFSTALVRTDDFNRADIGANWSSITGYDALSIFGSETVTSTGAPGAGYWNADTFNANQYASTQFHGTLGGPAVRCTSTKIVFVYVVNATTIQIYQNTGTGHTQVGADFTVTALTVDEDYIKLSISGTTATLWINDNGAGYASQGTREIDASISSGAPGLAVTTGHPLDNWEGGNL